MCQTTSLSPVTSANLPRLRDIRIGLIQSLLLPFVGAKTTRLSFGVRFSCALMVIFASNAYPQANFADSARRYCLSHDTPRLRRLLVEHRELMDSVLYDGNKFNDETLLDAAVTAGDIPVVKMLLSLGANPNICNTNDDGTQPPIVSAVLLRKNALQMTRLLLDHGADPCLSNNSGYSAFHVLAEGGRYTDLRLFQLILSSPKLQINKVTRGHETALLLACEKSDKNRMIGLLLDHGADPFISDLSGRTPLVGAAFGCDVVAVRRLLKLGADPLAKTIDGRSPITEAECPEVIEIFREALASRDQSAGKSGSPASGFQMQDPNSLGQNEAQSPQHYNTFILRRNGNWYRYECVMGHYFKYDRQKDRVAEYDEHGFEVTINPSPKESNPINKNGVQLR